MQLPEVSKVRSPTGGKLQCGSPAPHIQITRRIALEQPSEGTGVRIRQRGMQVAPDLSTLPPRSNGHRVPQPSPLHQMGAVKTTKNIARRIVAQGKSARRSNSSFGVSENSPRYDQNPHMRVSSATIRSGKNQATTMSRKMSSMSPPTPLLDTTRRAKAPVARAAQAFSA